MNSDNTALDGVLVFEPRVFGDERGWFFESFNAKAFREATGHSAVFVQDNHSRSARGVLRGIHFQTGPAAQGKLVRATMGEVYDVAVDLRRSSATFGHWTAVKLSAENNRQLWIPAGFGHAFVVTSEWAEVQYKVDEFWSPKHERSLRWDDPVIGIDWPDVGQMQLSAKDGAALGLNALNAQGDLFE